MSTKQTVNEETGFSVFADFSDKNGDPLTPATLTYQIDNVTAGTSIVPETVVAAPAAVTEIKVLPAQNEIADQGKKHESMLITFIANVGLEDAITEEYGYMIKNLKFIN